MTYPKASAPVTPAVLRLANQRADRWKQRCEAARAQEALWRQRWEAAQAEVDLLRGRVEELEGR